ncbi:MAG TPA: hypothetical protein VLE95_06760 [Chlamydiales bacterium]|nr:hypothetical protein [Chlamydiales bacterium]
MASRVTSSASAPVTISDPIIDRIVEEGKRLSALNDMDLQAAVKEMPKEALRPERFGDTIPWVKNMPYWRILRFCNAEQAGYLLNWITAYHMLGDYNKAFHAKVALGVMNTPELLPLFIDVVKRSRNTSFEGIDVLDLLLRHGEPASDAPFHKGLPEHVLKILKIENSVAAFDLQVDRQGVLEKRDTLLAGYPESVRERGAPDAKSALEDVSQKV